MKSVLLYWVLIPGMWAAVVSKVTAEPGSKEWVQGQLKCHKALLARSSCFLLIEHTPCSCKLLISIQSSEKVNSNGFWQFIHSFWGGIDFWSSLLYHFHKCHQDFSLFLMALTVLRNTGQVFFQTPLHWPLSDVFVHYYAEAMGFGKNNIEVKCKSHYIILEVYTISMIY